MDRVELVKKIALSSSALLIALSVSACGSSDSADSSDAAAAKTQACRSWSVNGESAARSILDLARSDEVDTATGNAVVKQLHDELADLAAIKGLPDADFEPFGDAAKVFPATPGGIFQLSPDNPSKRNAASNALAAIAHLCG